MLGIFDSGPAVESTSQSVFLFFDRAFSSYAIWIQSLGYFGTNVSYVLVVSFVFIGSGDVRLRTRVVIQCAGMIDCGTVSGQSLRARPCDKVRAEFVVGLCFGYIII